jgi:uncharacterized membrane protein (UPF0182 family)
VGGRLPPHAPRPARRAPEAGLTHRAAVPKPNATATPRRFADAGATQPGPEPGAPVEASGGLVSQAGDHYRRALQAQRDGDWAQYGEAIEQLGEVLEQLGSGPVLD